MVLLARLIDLCCWVLIADVLLSWVVLDAHQPVVILLRRLTDPVLRPIRAVLPTPGLDFSPMIAILLLQAFRRLLISLP